MSYVKSCRYDQLILVLLCCLLTFAFGGYGNDGSIRQMSSAGTCNDSLSVAVSRYLDDREEQVLSAVGQSATSENAATVRWTLNSWKESGLQQKFWADVQTALSVDKVILSLEIGNTGVAEYDCKAIVESDTIYYIVQSAGRRLSTSSDSLIVSPISASTLSDLMNEVVRRYLFPALASDYKSLNPGEDQDVGVLTLATERGVKVLVQYPLHYPEDPLVASVFGFLSGVFWMSAAEK